MTAAEIALLRRWREECRDVTNKRAGFRAARACGHLSADRDREDAEREYPMPPAPTREPARPALTIQKYTVKPDRDPTTGAEAGAILSHESSGYVQRLSLEWCGVVAAWFDQPRQRETLSEDTD